MPTPCNIGGPSNVAALNVPLGISINASCPIFGTCVSGVLPNPALCGGLCGVHAKRAHPELSKTV